MKNRLGLMQEDIGFYATYKTLYASSAQSPHYFSPCVARSMVGPSLTPLHSIPLQLLWREWKLPGLGRRPSLLSQRGGLSQWAGCASQREGGGSVEKGQLWWPGPEDKARTLPMWAPTLPPRRKETKERFKVMLYPFIYLTCSLYLHYWRKNSVL